MEFLLRAETKGGGHSSSDCEPRNPGERRGLSLSLDEILGGRPEGWEAQRLELWRFGERGDAADPKAIKLRREVGSGL